MSGTVKTAGPVVVVAALVALPWMGVSEYMIHNMVLILLYVGLASAWNLPVFGGQVSLGHAAFVGIGAYTSTLLFVHLDVNPWFGMLAAIGTSMLTALLVAIPLIRLRGPFFTLATLAIVEVLRRLAIYLRDLTQGSEGITIPFETGWQYLSFPTRMPYYYIALGMAVLAVLAAWLLYRSRFGYMLRATAVDEEAVRALGVNTHRIQVGTLMLSAALTAVLGVFYAQYVFVIDPDTVFSTTMFSIQPALCGIIGGMGTVIGPIVGAAIMTPLGEALRSYLAGAQQGLSFLIYGVVLMVIVVVMPGGIVSGVQRVRAWLARRRRLEVTDESAARV